MTKPNPYRKKVLTALETLSASEHMIGPFVVWFDAKSIATEAGVALATARRYLEDLSHCRGVRTRVVRGSRAYRYDTFGA